MSENETITQSELANRLAIPVSDLLLREEAAALVGLKPSSLSNLRADGPAFYRSTRAATGGVSWYPKANLEQYARHKRSKAGSRFSGLIGQLQWPDAALQTVPVHQVVEMIAKWKQRELYRRAQCILNDPLADDSEFKDELRMFGEPWGGDRLTAIADEEDSAADERRRDVFKSLDDQAKAVTQKLRMLCDSEGIYPSFVHPSYQVLDGLLETAWREVIKAEGRWRAADYTGMPSKPPS